MEQIDTLKAPPSGWGAYFEAAEKGDLFAAFDALASLGMRPLPITEDPHTGKIKIPAMGKGWGESSIEKRREQLERFINQGVPVGIGCQVDGFVVADIDPPNKDRAKLPQAWKEAAAILLGSEDWPTTLTVATQAGCHVWFKLPVELIQKWRGHGKLKLALPSGGAVEFFTGNDKQTQVACAPSEGKQIAVRCEPIALPKTAVGVILDLLEPEPAIKHQKSTIEATNEEVDWYLTRLDKLKENTRSANEGDRHDVFRASCKVMAGYAAAMNLEKLQDKAYAELATAHKEVKPEVTDYVLRETFRWAWDRGMAKPFERPRLSKGGGGVKTRDNGDKLTDLQFSELVINRFQSQFRYCEDWKQWVTWDKKKGVWVRSGVKHYEFFKSFAFGDQEYLGSASKIKAAATLCMSDARVMAEPSDFDALPDFINVKNGVIDLETMQLLDHDPAFLSTKQANVVFDPAAKCPKFLATLERVQPNGHIQSFLQRWLGTVLTGRTLSESVVNYGDGANGKSTILESIGLVMGSYFAKMPRGFIAKTKNDRHPAELITLYGARFALASETDISDALDEAKIKMILGDGTITARGMHENFWTFNPTHKFDIAANHMPSIVGQDSGIWRRLAFVPWTETIPENERKPEFEKTLFNEEASGILNWLLNGLRFYRAVGLEIPPQIRSANQEVKASSDWLAEFFAECLTTQSRRGTPSEDRVRASSVYEIYKKWALSNGVTVLPSSKAVPLFTKRVEEMGLEIKKPQNVRWYCGIRVKEEIDHENEIDAAN